MHRTYEQKNLIKQADPLGWNVRGIRTPPPPSPPGIMKFIYFFVKNYPISSPWKNWPPPLVKAPYPHMSYFTHRTQQHDATVKDFLLFLSVIFHLLPS